MQAPRAASKVETLKPAMGGSSHQHPGSPHRSPASRTVRGTGLRTVSQLRTAPEEQARVCTVTSLPILPGDNRPQGTSRAAFSCHWHKRRPAPEAAVLGRRCCLGSLGLPSLSPAPASCHLSPSHHPGGSAATRPHPHLLALLPSVGEAGLLPHPTLTFCN